MSSIAVQGGAGGTGTVTLLAPSTSTNRTITLPDSTATLLTASAGAISPSMLDTQAQYTGFKNRIINGAMVIDERNKGAIFNPPPNQGYSLDRWTTWLSQNTYSVQRNAGSVTPPAGFSNYLGLTVTAATTIGVSDYFGVGQKVEGFNIADLGWGTASAQPITISFWVRSSLTGNFGALIRRGDGGQYYGFIYAISAANTWEYKTVTIAGPTTGTWAADNATGLFLLFGFGAGANQTASSNNTWVTGGVLGALGAAPVVATNGATWQVTGVSLEKGSTATAFDYRPYGTELALCQRYYCHSNNTLGAPDVNTPSYVAASIASDIEDGALCSTTFPVIMRATPSMTVGRMYSFDGSKYKTITSIATSAQGIGYVNHDSGNSGAGYVMGRSYKFSWIASAEL